MGIFSTKILLATDGSGNAELAAGASLGLAESTGSAAVGGLLAGLLSPRHLP